jgi:hypothetical protein
MPNHFCGFCYVVEETLDDFAIAILRLHFIDDLAKGFFLKMNVKAQILSKYAWELLLRETKILLKRRKDPQK